MDKHVNKFQVVNSAIKQIKYDNGTERLRVEGESDYL